MLMAQPAARRLNQALNGFQPLAGAGHRYWARLKNYSVLAGADSIDLKTAAGEEWHLRFAGARAVDARPRDRLPGHLNYLLGRPADWRFGVARYREIYWPRLYPGMRGWLRQRPGGNLELGFRLAPGVRLAKLRIVLRGGRACLSPGGGLEAELREGKLSLRRPRFYQLWRGRRRRLRGGFRLTSRGQLSFRVHGWRHGALLIDPTLTYASFLGGSGTDNATAVALDATGNIYLAGETNSSDFPIANALQPGCGNECGEAIPTAFIAKFSSGAGSLIYATFLGGSGATTPAALALDAAGDLFIAGRTTAPDFPLVQPLSSHCDQCSTASGDGFLAELNPAGNALVASTYFGGSGDDHIAALALDAQGDAWLAGWTFSADFPLQNALQPDCGGCASGLSDTFIAALAPGNQLLFSTYLGGNASDRAEALAIGAQGNIYVAGWTLSADFPTRAPLQADCDGCLDPAPQADTFLAQLAPGKAPGEYTLLASTYFGGSNWDEADALAINPVNGDLFAAGKTLSADFPLASPLQSGCKACQSGSGANAWLAEFDPSVSTLLFSTYLGGSVGDAAMALAVNAQGEPLIAGITLSPDFPLVNPLQNSLNRSGSGSAADAFLAKANPQLTAWVVATFLGGSANDWASGLALDANGNAWLAGATLSSDFPVANPLQAACDGCPANGDAWLAEIRGLELPLARLVPGSLTFAAQGENTTSAAQTLTLTNAGDAPLAIASIATTGDFAQSNNCPASLSANADCSISVSFTPTALGTLAGKLTVTGNTNSGSAALALYGSGIAAPIASFTPSTPAFVAVDVGASDPPLAVQLANTGAAGMAIQQVTINGPFAQTSNCPANLAVGASCDFQIVFTPSTAGANSGGLTITDNAPGSPQMVALQGEGEDFSLTAAASGADTASVTAGQTAQFSLALSSLGGFAGSIALSCAGAPALASCAISPAAVNLAAGGRQTLSISVTTTAGTRLPPDMPAAPTTKEKWGFPASALLLLLLIAAARSVSRAGAWASVALPALIAIAMLAGCGGESTTSSSPQPLPGTPAGAYTLTITASSGALNHKENLTLNVQ